MLGTWFHEHPYGTDNHILSFHFLPTNVLIVSRVNENVNMLKYDRHGVGVREDVVGEG